MSSGQNSIKHISKSVIIITFHLSIIHHSCSSKTAKNEPRNFIFGAKMDREIEFAFRDLKFKRHLSDLKLWMAVCGYEW